MFRIILHLPKVKLIGHPQIFPIFYRVGHLRHHVKVYKVVSSLDLSGDHCDPVWRSGKILVRQTGGPCFNLRQVLVFSLFHLVCTSLPVHHHHKNCIKNVILKQFDSH